jgi:hypothetical protein
MDPRRLRAGEGVAAVAGAALIAALFAPWYDGLSGWAALGVIDVLLAFVAALALALALVTSTQRVPAVPLALSVLLAILALPATLLVLFRALDLPDGAVGRDWGLWLALAGTIGVGVGALLAMADERLSPPGHHTDATGRPAPPPPPIEAIAADRLRRRSGEQ